MLKSLSCVLLASATVLAAGACGDDNDAIQSVSGVVPADVFLGRQSQVLVLGSGTQWEDGVSVDFGPDVTVSELLVASPSALIATIEVDAAAEQGARDVTVDDGSDPLTLEGAFSLGSPLAVTVEGDMAQGSIAIVKVRNLDILAPFDTTSEGDGFFSPLVFTNLNVTVGEGMVANVATAEPFAIELTVSIDVEATTGAVDLDILSGPESSKVSFPLPAAFDVAERKATPLTAEQISSITVEKAFGTKLFSFTPASLAVVEFLALSDDPVAAPGFALLGPDGSFNNLRAFSNVAATAGTGPFYLVFWDNTGAFGYSADLLATEAAATGMAEAEPNDDAVGAQLISSLPTILQGATLSGLSDADYIELTIDPDDLGKSLRVITFGDDPLTDPMIDVVQVTGENETSLLDAPFDISFHEDFTSPPLDAAGTYYIKILASDFGTFDPAHGTYEAAVMLVGTSD